MVEESFVVELDNVIQKTCKQIFKNFLNLSKESNVELNDLEFDITNLPEVQEFLKEKELDEFFNVIFKASIRGGLKVDWQYKHCTLHPSGYYILPDNYKEANLYDILKECIKQDTNCPNIMHLQVK